MQNSPGYLGSVKYVIPIKGILHFTLKANSTDPILIPWKVPISEHHYNIKQVQRKSVPNFWSIFSSNPVIYWTNHSVISYSRHIAKVRRLWHYLCKAFFFNTKCKIFPKEGGRPQKLHLKKCLYTVKRGFKINFFNTRMCFGNI